MFSDQWTFSVFVKERIKKLSWSLTLLVHSSAVLSPLDRKHRTALRDTEDFSDVVLWP
jgi:hypothetical protein